MKNKNEKNKNQIFNIDENDYLLELGMEPNINRDQINKVLGDVSDSAKKHQRKFKDKSPDDVEFSDDSKDVSYAETNKPKDNSKLK